MSTTLPERTDLVWYKKSAKKKLAALRAEKRAAKLAEAQLAVAREHGFASWRKLVAAIEERQPAVLDLEPFLTAIRDNDVASAKKLLINIPALANARDSHGAPVLSVAVGADRPAVVRLLLDHGADPTARYGRSAHTPLSWAMTVGAFKSAEVLLKAGVKADLFCAAGLDRVDDVAAYFDADGFARPGSSMTGSSRYLNDALLPSPPTNPIELASDALYLACRNGRAKTVRYLLTRRVDLAFRAYMGGTALHWAYCSGEPKVVELLLDAGADATSRDDVMDATPRAFGICVAANWGNMTWLKRQLRLDPTLANLLDGRGAPLHEAARAGQLGAARALLKAGADVNLPNGDGATPLHLAAFEGHLEMAKLLVRAGANVHAEDDEHGSTPGGWADFAGRSFDRIACVDVADFLKQREKKTWSAKTLPPRRQTHQVVKWKPIMDAAFDGDVARIKKLIAAGADPNAVSTTPGAHRPLHRAIEAKKGSPRGPKHEAAVEALLAAGADPHARGGHDRLTALQLAAQDSPQFVPILIDRFRPLDVWHACAVLDVRRVESLLKKDPSRATAVDVNRYQPLHYVAGSRLYLESAGRANDQLRLARVLIDAGADVNATFTWSGPGDWPIPVLYKACGANDNAPLTELLMRAGARPYDDESVYHASDEGHAACLAVIEQYADKKLLAEEATKCLRTQMHWGNSRGMKWLLEHGADPNSLHPKFGNSAMHSAAKFGSSDAILDLLLTLGGDPARPNANGDNAIDLAVAAKKDRVVKRLRQWTVARR